MVFHEIRVALRTKLRAIIAQDIFGVAERRNPRIDGFDHRERLDVAHWYELDKSAESVNEADDVAVSVSGLWKWSHDIDGQCFEGPRRDECLKEPCLLPATQSIRLRTIFDALAAEAAFAETSDLIAHLRPPISELRGDHFIHFARAVMQRAMDALQDTLA